MCSVLIIFQYNKQTRYTCLAGNSKQDTGWSSPYKGRIGKCLMIHTHTQTHTIKFLDDIPGIYIRHDIEIQCVIHFTRNVQCQQYHTTRSNTALQASPPLACAKTGSSPKISNWGSRNRGYDQTSIQNGFWGE